MEQIIRNAGIKCEEYRDSGYHCAESIIRACADALDIQLPEAVLKATGGFSGGGGGAREGCGLLEAGVALISFVFGRIRNDEDDEGCFYLIRIYHERFTKELGSINCKVLRPENVYLKGLIDCGPIFPRAAQILADIILNGEKLIQEMPVIERRDH